MGTYTDGFVTATFSHMQLEQWEDAVNMLTETESPLEGPGFYAYKGLIYRFIMARAKNPAIANPVMEQQAAYYATNDKGHYGALLRMWQGENVTEELERVIGEMNGAEQQEASGEALFHRGAYAKFVVGNEIVGKAMLDSLNRIAPYGSIEWIYGQRVLQ